MRTALLFAAVALFTRPAAAQTVSYDFDRSADFSRYRTYAWAPGTPVPDAFNHKRIVSEVDSQLAAKGLVRADSGQTPDLLVAYHANFNRNLRVTTMATGSAGYRFASRSGSARAQEILVGTLVVDLADAGTRSLVWRGSATKQVDVNAAPEKREKSINQATAKLFRNYPPRS